MSGPLTENQSVDTALRVWGDHTPPRFERAKSGWLIEAKFGGVPAWWNGMRFNLHDEKAWDFDASKGILFADWASAGAMLNNLQVESMKVSGSAHYLSKLGLSVTEHVWQST
jgi:hypothetical protein